MTTRPQSEPRGQPPDGFSIRQGPIWGQPLISSALALAESGLPVFPCNRDKKPITEDGFKSATRDPGVIREMFARDAAALIGIPTGRASGRVAIDVDPRHGGNAWLSENRNRLPPTLTHGTPSGGVHLVFCDPPGVEIRNSNARIAPGVDVRGTGGYAIVPPSKGYTIKHDGPIAAMPEWLVKLCLPPERAVTAPPGPRRPPRADDGSRYGLKALDEECAAIHAAPFGQQEVTLNNAALKIGGLVAGGELSESYALAELLTAGNAMPSEPGHESWRAPEIERKVKRAFEDGKRTPRPPADNGSNATTSPHGQGEAGARAKPSDEPPPEPQPELGPEPQPKPEPQPAADRPGWPAPLGRAAQPGIVGEFVAALLPHTEADTAALVFQLLAAVGNVIGDGPHYLVESDRHPARLNVLLVGQTAKGRKGTSWGRVRQALSNADPGWADQRIASGLSSGEGLIYEVRDPVEKTNKNGQHEIVDEGVADKRLLVISTEFAGILPVMTRSGNTLSPVIRDAWDSGYLRTLTKNSPLRATGAHISQIGHCTANELLQHLDAVQVGNGFANRYLYVCVTRARVLPDGGGDIKWDGFAAKLGKIITETTSIERVAMDDKAKKLWHVEYERLSASKPGLLGAVIARAEAQVVRLALIYALLDRRGVIYEQDLQAALECW